MKRCVILLWLTACGGSDGGQPGWMPDTLPGGGLRAANTGTDGVWRDGGAWRLVPELVLGGDDSDGAKQFTSIAGLEVGDDGRIYVLDRQARELRIFTPDGAHIRTGGGSGSGPGEFTVPNGLLRTHPDTLLVVDQRGGRYSLLTTDGDFARAVPRRAGQDRAEIEASAAFERWQQVGGEFEWGRIPATKPYFDSLYVDPDDHLWVGVPRSPREIAFRVFDPQGRHLGLLRLDGLARETTVPPVVRNGRLHIVARDELDVHQVHVFRIAR